jgi:hypothetical protein
MLGAPGGTVTRCSSLWGVIAQRKSRGLRHNHDHDFRTNGMARNGSCRVEVIVTTIPEPTGGHAYEMCGRFCTAVNLDDAQKFPCDISQRFVSGPVYWHLYSLETLLPALFVIVLYCLYVWIIWYKLAFTAYLLQLLESGLKMQVCIALTLVQ